MARYKSKRPSRRSSRRYALRRNAQPPLEVKDYIPEGSDNPIPQSKFFRGLLKQQSGAIEAVNEKVQARKDKNQRSAEATTAQTRDRRTDKARAERELREAAQVRGTRAQASFMVEDDPVRLTDDGVEVKGNVIEGVAYVITLPALRQQIWKWVSADDLKPNSNFRVRSSAVSRGYGQETEALRQRSIENYDPEIAEPEEFQLRLDALKGEALVATSEQRAEVRDAMLSERVDLMLGAEHDLKLDAGIFLLLAARKQTGGFTDITVTDGGKNRMTAYVVKIDQSDPAFKSFQPVAFKGRERERGDDRFTTAANKVLSEGAKTLGLVESDRPSRRLGRYSVEIVAPTTARTRAMGRQRMKNYPLATYKVVGKKLASSGPLYLRINPGGRKQSYIVGIRYRTPMKRRGDLLALYGSDDPRSRNPYYSLVPSGFRQSYDPGAYSGGSPDEDAFLDASRTTMKQFAAVRDTVKTLGSFSRTVNRIRSLFTDWTSAAARGRSRRALREDISGLACLMTLSTAGIPGKDPLVLLLRDQQNKALNALPGLMQSYVGLFFLLRNIITEADLKATKMFPARNFFAFSSTNPVFAPFHADLMDMKNHVAALIGQTTEAQEFDFAAIASVPALSPMQEMLITANQQQRIESTLDEVYELYNSLPQGEQRDKAWTVIQDLEATRAKKRAEAKASRQARMGAQEAARAKLAADQRLGAMSAYQYRRYLASQSAANIIEVYTELLMSPRATLPLEAAIDRAEQVMGLQRLPADARRDKLLCFLLLYAINNSQNFIDALFTVGSAIAYNRSPNQSEAITAWKGGAMPKIRDLAKMHGYHVKMRQGKHLKDELLLKGSVARRNEAIRDLAAFLNIGLVSHEVTTGTGGEKTVYLSSNSRRFTDLLTYFNETEDCLDEMFQREDQKKNVMLARRHDPQMLGLLLFGITMDLFTPAVSNYLVPILPDSATGKSYRYAQKGEQYFAMAQETESVMLKKLKLPDYRQMGQRMKAQYGQDVYYTYNPVLFAYARQRGRGAYRLPSSLEKLSNGFGAYGNFIVLVREVVNELANHGQPIDQGSIARVFNQFYDEYRFPGVLPLAGRTEEKREESFVAQNEKLKAAAYKAISLAGRMTSVPATAGIETGIATYGVGKSIEGPQAKKLIAGLHEKMGRLNFLTAVAQYARAILPGSVLAKVDTPENVPEAMKQTQQRKAAIADAKKAIEQLPKLQQITARRQLNKTIKELSAGSDPLPKRLEDALVKWVKGYLGAGRHVKTREILGKGFAEQVQKAVNFARQDGALTYEEQAKLVNILDGLAYLYMKTTAYEMLAPVGVGAARLPDAAGPAMQQAGARMAQYAESLKMANRQIFKFY